MTRTRNLALSAILSALAVALLYLASILPTGGLALAAAAGVLPCVVVLQCGFGFAVMHYGVACVLALLLVPDKVFVLWYVFALGHYGILKLLIERRRGRLLRWGLKLAVFAVSVGMLYTLFSAAFAAGLPELPHGALFAILAVVFLIYDVGLTGVLRAYSVRIARYFHKGV